MQYIPGKSTKDKGITKVSTQQWDLLEEQGRKSENVRKKNDWRFDHNNQQHTIHKLPSNITH